MRVRRLLFAFLAVSAIAAGCAPAEGEADDGRGSGGTLEGTHWILRSYALDGALVAVADTEFADAEFLGHQVNGTSGCNTFTALYRSAGRRLNVAPAAVTLMACAESAMAFEQAFLAGLDATRWYTVRRSELTTYTEGGEVALIFDAAPRNPLLGNWVVDSFETTEGSVTTPLEGTELAVTFNILSVGGFAGCNSFSGTYGTNGNVVRIGPLATTRLACEQEVMDQETAFLETLRGAALIELGAQSVLLTDLSGSVLVALRRPTIPEPGASPDPSEEPSASASAAPSETPAPSDTPAPSATPEPTPTPEPTAAPTPTAAPSAPPLPSIPPVAVATCDVALEGDAVATIGYPDAWSTVEEPPELACRYFDPEEVTVPEDPATLSTAVMIQTPDLSYEDAVAAAVEPETWDVRAEVEMGSEGLPMTFVEGEALVDIDGVAAGERRAAYIIDTGPGGVLTLFTTGAAGDPSYAGDAVVMFFMLSRSVFVTPA